MMENCKNDKMQLISAYPVVIELVIRIAPRAKWKADTICSHFSNFQIDRR